MGCALCLAQFAPQNLAHIALGQLDPALTEDEVANYCHQNLTGYKRPKYIEFRDELPKSNVGKILRRELRKA